MKYLSVLSLVLLAAPLTACEQHPLLIFLRAYALNFVTVNTIIWKFNHYAGSAMRISLLLLKKGQDFLWHVKLDFGIAIKNSFSPSNINSSKSIVQWIWRYKEYFFIYVNWIELFIHSCFIDVNITMDNLHKLPVSILLLKL